ncbi:hypothetical protein Y1Q_0003106 [Alligator mississippiensis]|uniref:Uncharacterized protein n=1 Tax=Alligator mississippiensis TaxID=8496 RepID=A0A151MDK4_ALLMI|nr:hypothetical protein Y1Q_0003106 [Alligator mississippiensis]
MVQSLQPASHTLEDAVLLILPGATLSSKVPGGSNPIQRCQESTALSQCSSWMWLHSCYSSSSARLSTRSIHLSSLVIFLPWLCFCHIHLFCITLGRRFENGPPKGTGHQRVESTPERVETSEIFVAHQFLSEIHS